MSDGPATYFKYDLCLGSITGLISISYDTNPGNVNPLAVPINFKITWNGLQFESGFRGSSSFDTNLLDAGYTATTGGSTGTLEFNKNSETPSCGLLEVFSPLSNSKADFNVVCGVTPVPPQTPGPTPTPPAVTPTAACVMGCADAPPPTIAPDGPFNMSLCCPGAGAGGDVHFYWNGNSAVSGGSGMWNNFAVADDNHTWIGDHWVIEWCEIKQNGNVNAIFSRRTQPCLFPGTTVCSSVKTIGSLSSSGLSFRWKRKKVPVSNCGCTKDEYWYTRSCSIRPTRIFENQKFGGIQWDFMKWISGYKNSNLQNGITGPFGYFSSFSRNGKFRIFKDDTPTAQDVMNFYNQLDADIFSANNIINDLIDMAAQIDEYKQNETLDLTQAVSYRNSNMPKPLDLGSSDPCCKAGDINWLDSPCGIDEAGWWSKSDCTCEYSESDPGYGLGGPFETQAECFNVGSCGSSFDCIDGTCVEVAYGDGPFSTYQDCLDYGCEILPTATAPTPTATMPTPTATAPTPTATMPTPTATMPTPTATAPTPTATAPTPTGTRVTPGPTAPAP